MLLNFCMLLENVSTYTEALMCLHFTVFLIYFKLTLSIPEE
jgi:hypothetical protein